MSIEKQLKNIRREVIDKIYARVAQTRGHKIVFFPTEPTYNKVSACLSRYADVNTEFYIRGLELRDDGDLVVNYIVYYLDEGSEYDEDSEDAYDREEFCDYIEATSLNDLYDIAKALTNIHKG